MLCFGISEITTSKPSQQTQFNTSGTREGSAFKLHGLSDWLLLSREILRLVLRSEVNKLQISFCTNE